MTPSPRETATDHDLLVRVDEKLLGLTTIVNEMRDGTVRQLTDHEHRLRSIETGYVQDDVYSPAHKALIKSIDSMKRIVYMAMGGWVLLTILVAIGLKFIGKN